MNSTHAMRSATTTRPPPEPPHADAPMWAHRREMPSALSICRELSAGSEQRRIGDRRGDRAGAHDANARHGRQQTPDLTLSMPPGQAPFDLSVSWPLCPP